MIQFVVKHSIPMQKAHRMVVQAMPVLVVMWVVQPPQIRLEPGIVRANTERITTAELSGYTVEKYVIESIVDPGAYIVPGYAAGAMPGDFGQRMSLQDLADIVAYIETQ